RGLPLLRPLRGLGQPRPRRLAPQAPSRAGRQGAGPGAHTNGLEGHARPDDRALEDPGLGPGVRLPPVHALRPSDARAPGPQGPGRGRAHPRRRPAVKDGQIHEAVRILKREIKRWKVPVVGLVAETQDPFLVLVSTLLSLRTRDAVTEAA